MHVPIDIWFSGRTLTLTFKLLSVPPQSSNNLVEIVYSLRNMSDVGTLRILEKI